MRKGKQVMEHSMTDAILNQIKADAFERGIKTALNELRDVYGEGLEETDIWAEYMEASK
jgi:proline racemase